MDQRQSTERRAEGPVGTFEQAPPQRKQRGTRRTGQRYFVNWEPEKQREAFFTWLPKELHDTPGIDWTQLAPEIMRYCIYTIGTSPDAAALAVSAAALHGAMEVASQLTALREANVLLRELRAADVLRHLSDLKQERAWDEWARRQDQRHASRAWHILSCYISIVTTHFPHYLLRLGPLERARMQQYALPLPPLGLREKYFPWKRVHADQQASRKATTDILVPLYPILRQLIRFRKQLAERTLLAIRSARRKVEAGETVLPYRFQQTDIIPEVNRDASTIAEVQITGRA